MQLVTTVTVHISLIHCIELDGRLYNDGKHALK